MFTWFRITYASSLSPEERAEGRQNSLVGQTNGTLFVGDRFTGAQRVRQSSPYSCMRRT